MPGAFGRFVFGMLRSRAALVAENEVLRQQLYDSVRRFLRRRHKLAASGYRRFPKSVVFGELGVLSPLTVSRPPLRTRGRETRPRAG